MRFFKVGEAAVKHLNIRHFSQIQTDTFYMISGNFENLRLRSAGFNVWCLAKYYLYPQHGFVLTGPTNTTIKRQEYNVTHWVFKLRIAQQKPQLNNR